jgi:hypothetical protein
MLNLSHKTPEVYQIALKLVNDIYSVTGKFQNEVARSSAVEIDTQIEISFNLRYLQNIDIKSLESHLLSVFRILCKMIDNLDK